MRLKTVPYTIQTFDGGNHRRKDRLHGGLYVTDGVASMALSTMAPNETLIVTRGGESADARRRIRFTPKR